MSVNLFNGDCLEVMPNIEDNSIDMVITSPPYYNARDYSNFNGFDIYIGFMLKVLNKCKTLLKDGGFIAVNSSSVITARAKRSQRSIRHNIPSEISNILKDLWFVEEFIWKKPEGAGVGRGRQFHQNKNPISYKTNPDTERIVLYQKPFNGLNDSIIKNKPREIVSWGHGFSEVWNINPVRVKGHTAPFPEEIPNRLIRLYTWKNDIILDPFMGSGTTGVACKNLNRNFIGIEKDEEYFKLAKDRIESVSAPV